MLYCVVWANICSGPGLDPKGRAFHRSRRVLNCLGLKHTVRCFTVNYMDTNTKYKQLFEIICAKVENLSNMLMKKKCKCTSARPRSAIVQCAFLKQTFLQLFFSVAFSFFNSL